MAHVIAIVGPSGKGKSTSILPFPELGIKGLNPKETVLINVASKSLPTKGWKNHFDTSGKLISQGGNYIATDNSDTICAALTVVNEKRPEVKNVVVDDAQYIMAFAYMEKAKQKGYDKFNELAQIGFNPVSKARQLSRQDLMVFFVYHDEVGDNNERKIKTLGKMLDSTITMEGLFTVVLFAAMERNNVNGTVKYHFTTNADGTTTAKSPYGMFKDIRIPNDLGLVRDSILAYEHGQ